MEEEIRAIDLSEYQVKECKFPIFAIETLKIPWYKRLWIVLQFVTIFPIQYIITGKAQLWE
jgi:hypothetical protein